MGVTIPEGETKQMTEQERSEAIKRQVEYYFSRQNLSQDSFLLSKMDQDHSVDISVITEFKMMKQLSADVDYILSAIKDSDKIIIDVEKKRIKPVPNVERTTLILRNIPSSATEESVRTLLSSVNVPSILAIRPDVGDNWFVTFENQESTRQAMESVKGLKWESKTIGCAIKCESFLKALAVMPPNAFQQPVHVDGNGQYRNNNGRRSFHGARKGGFNGPNAGEGKGTQARKGKGRAGRETANKTNTAASPEAQEIVKPEFAPKSTDFPVLGSAAPEGNNEPSTTPEAKSGAATPPLCSTPCNENAPAEPPAPKSKMSYAQMALSKVAAAAAAPAAEATVPAVKAA